MVCAKLIIDGNAVYEIDEECLRQRRKQIEEMERRERSGAESDNRK